MTRAGACTARMIRSMRPSGVSPSDRPSYDSVTRCRSTSAANGSSAFVYRPAISPSGRFVSFQTRGYGGLGYADGASETSNSGLYLRDRQAGVTIPIPRPPGVEGDRVLITEDPDEDTHLPT